MPNRPENAVAWLALPLRVEYLSGLADALGEAYGGELTLQGMSDGDQQGIWVLRPEPAARRATAAGEGVGRGNQGFPGP